MSLRSFNHTRRSSKKNFTKVLVTPKRMPRPTSISPIARSVYLMQPIDYAWHTLQKGSAHERNRRKAELRREKRMQNTPEAQSTRWEEGREQRQSEFEQLLAEWEEQNQQKEERLAEIRAATPRASRRFVNRATADTDFGADEKARALWEAMQEGAAPKPEPPSETNPFE